MTQTYKLKNRRLNNPHCCSPKDMYTTNSPRRKCRALAQIVTQVFVVLSVDIQLTTLPSITAWSCTNEVQNLGSNLYVIFSCSSAGRYEQLRPPWQSDLWYRSCQHAARNSFLSTPPHPRNLSCHVIPAGGSVLEAMPQVPHSFAMAPARSCVLATVLKCTSSGPSAMRSVRAATHSFGRGESWHKPNPPHSWIAASTTS